MTTLTLAGISPRRCSVRVGVTVTVSSRVAGASTRSRSPVCAGGTCVGFLREPSREDDDRQLTGFGHVDGEPAVGSRGAAMLGASGAHDDGGARKRRRRSNRVRPRK